MNFGNFIANLRKKYNYNQEFVARELGISRPTYIQLERGERDLTVQEANILAIMFNFSLTDFLEQRQTNVSLKITGKHKTPTPSNTELRISIPQERLDKFKQVLLYILKKVGGKPNIGMTAIYKILYFIDFDFYEKYEEQLMGLTYIKNHYGPTPIVFEHVIQELLAQDDIEIIKSKYYQREQKKYLINPKLKLALNLLTGSELAHIDGVLARLSDLNATALSDLSHKDVPWISAEAGKPIDYEAVFYRTADTSVREYDVNEDD